MARTRWQTTTYALLAALAACGGGSPVATGPGAGPGPGMPGKGGGATATGGTKGGTTPPPGPAGMPGKGPGAGPGMGTGGGPVIIGIPTPGAPGTIFPGGGPTGAAPLAAGCTPASAHECPTSSGVCATSATSHPTGTSTGSICFYDPNQATTTTTTTTKSSPAATIEYLHETAGGQEYYRFRITFDPAFVDNTYGTNAIGWGQKGHTFKDLVGSDHAELSLFDGKLALVSMFDIDYITASSGATCGYAALGVSGGEGKMLTGSAQHVLASTTSLDRNLNGCGYCKNAACGGDCTVNSPATTSTYTPASAAPNWDYRVVYEVWMDAAVFASQGFGGASITFVHASPSKASSNTITVIPKPCDGCPPGTEAVELEDQGTVCKKVCPDGQYSQETEIGPVCVTGCPAGTRPVVTGTGVKCTSGCASGYGAVMTSDGSSCVKLCPDGSVPVTNEGTSTCPSSTNIVG